MKPTLKKVSKYENKFAKLQKKAAEFNFRNQLKVVKKKEFTLDEEEKEVRKDQSAASIGILFTNSYLSFLSHARPCRRSRTGQRASPVTLR